MSVKSNWVQKIIVKLHNLTAENIKRSKSMFVRLPGKLNIIIQFLIILESVKLLPLEKE